MGINTVWSGPSPRQVSRKRKTDSLMQGKLKDGMCNIDVNDRKAMFTFHNKGKSTKGEVALAGCDVSMSAQVAGSVNTSFFIKLYLNDFESAFPKIEIGSLFHDWDITMSIGAIKGRATIEAIDICQEMDTIQGIGSMRTYAYGGTRYVEINGGIR